MIDINNRKDILDKLCKLKEDSEPLFGKMTPQHMIEHLIFLVRCSNGKLPQKLYLPSEKAELFKTALIYSKKELTPGFNSPILETELSALEFPNLEIAIHTLQEELENFYEYFSENKNSKPVSPVLGELDKAEWIIFHNKHFTHHFKQFNLV